MYRNVPFLGMHQLTHLPGKDKRAKKKTKTIHEKKKTHRQQKPALLCHLPGPMKILFPKFESIS